MTRRCVGAAAAAIVIAFLGETTALAQLSPTSEWATHAQNQYLVQANVTYLTANGFEAKLDVYRRRDVQTPQPTLVFYHGGGWIGGTKEASFMSVMPWIELFSSFFDIVDESKFISRKDDGVNALSAKGNCPKATVT